MPDSLNIAVDALELLRRRTESAAAQKEALRQIGIVASDDMEVMVQTFTFGELDQIATALASLQSAEPSRSGEDLKRIAAFERALRFNQGAFVAALEAHGRNLIGNHDGSFGAAVGLLCDDLRAVIGRSPQASEDQAAARLGKFCDACQALPSAGYCNLAGCPMPRPTPAGAEKVSGDPEGEP